MSNFTITIVGTGVIGTSLGLALKQQTDTPLRLLAHDKELSRAKAAVSLGAFDKAEWNLVNACEKADLIVLAIPLNGIKPSLEAIGPYLKQGAVVTDTCRNKVAPLAAAAETLPAHIHFVGGDPVVQPAGSGHDHASADLFKNRLYCLTPAPAANEEAVQLLVNFVGLLGGEPFFLDAAEHDGLTTATELLPNLLSVTLLNLLSTQGSWRELRKLAGGLFERVSSGADTDPDALKDSFYANREALLHWLDQYLLEIRTLRTLLTDTESGEVLAQKIDQAAVERLNWLKDFQQGRFNDPEIASPKIETPGLLSQMIGFGGLRRRGGDDKESKKR